MSVSFVPAEDWWCIIERPGGCFYQRRHVIGWEFSAEDGKLEPWVLVNPEEIITMSALATKHKGSVFLYRAGDAVCRCQPPQLTFDEPLHDPAWCSTCCAERRTA
jgi:hypothetical protein